jgi:hypothetical protein
VLGAGPTENDRQATLRFSQQPAPHPRVGSQEVRAALRDRLAEFIRSYPAFLGSKDPTEARSIPGRSPAPAGPGLSEATWVEQQLRENERILFTGAAGCSYCHIRGPEVSAAAAREQPLPKYAPTQIKNRWYTRSQFSHDSHRMEACSLCHPAETSTRTSDVLMPRISICQECHNTRAGGARSDCVECHLYHDRSREGLGGGTLTHAP